MTFLASAPIGCIHAMTVCCCSAFRMLYRSPYHDQIATIYQPPISYSIWTFIATLLGAGFALAVIITLGILFVAQFWSVMRNKTAIEVYICEKADDLTRSEDSTFVFPYDLGIKNNIKSFLFAGNGIDWPVKPGASVYALTVEQKRQKEAKRERSLDFIVVKYYSGKCCPLSYGWRVGCSSPINDEPRMQIHEGDRVVVSRGQGQWYYGQKVIQDENGKTVRDRGWFPKQCVVLDSPRSPKSVFHRLGKKDE